MSATSPPFRRFVVIGCPGAGKTTFSRALAARIGAPHIEIDALYHGPNWTTTPRDVVRAQVSERIAGEAWVVDGNYRSTCGDLVRPVAETVVWLDLPRHVVLRSVVARTLTRIFRGTVLWNGNRERWWNLIDPRPKENIVLWSVTQFGSYRERYAQEFAAASPERPWFRFRSRAEAWAWMERLPAQGAAVVEAAESSASAREQGSCK